VVSHRQAMRLFYGTYGVVCPEKGGAMNATTDALTTALLVALLVINRLVR
jgi:hypothetical protein